MQHDFLETGASRTNFRWRVKNTSLATPCQNQEERFAPCPRDPGIIPDKNWIDLEKNIHGNFDFFDRNFEPYFHKNSHIHWNPSQSECTQTSSDPIRETFLNLIKCAARGKPPTWFPRERLLSRYKRTKHNNATQKKTKTHQNTKTQKYKVAKQRRKRKNAHIQPVDRLEAGGKPWTWFPPGRLAEHIF